MHVLSYCPVSNCPVCPVLSGDYKHLLICNLRLMVHLATVNPVALQKHKFMFLYSHSINNGHDSINNVLVSKLFCPVLSCIECVAYIFLFVCPELSCVLSLKTK